MHALNTIGVTNPIDILRRSKATAIFITEVQFKKELADAYPSLVQEIERVLKHRTSTAEPLPLGDILPWVLCDLVNVHPDDALKIAVGWLALYVGGAVLDDLLDQGTESPSPERIMIPTALLCFAQNKLYPLVAGTSAQPAYEKALYAAMEYEIRDVQLQSKSGASNEKQNSAKLKNSAAIALAAVIGTATRNTTMDLLSFVEDIILPMQYLDDLLDLDDDYRSNNITIAVENALIPAANRRHRLSHEELLDALTSGGGLKRILSSIELSLKRATHKLSVGGLIGIGNVSANFFERLTTEVSDLRRWIASINLEILPNGQARRALINEIDRRLRVICQSS